MTLDLSAPIRLSLLENAEICDFLHDYKGSPGIFTRRPVPEDAKYPFIGVSPDIALGNADVLVSLRPIVTRDVVVYGRQPDDYRDVEACGYLIRDHFHRKRFSIQPEGYSIIDIVASGPIPAPTDDVKTVARLVSLTIRLQRRP